MTQLFKKVACFTDLHVGHRGNSEVHNQDCLDFANWFVKEAKLAGCDTCIMLGDFHHNRNNVNLKTMQTMIRIVEILGKSFKHTYLLVGNHDAYHKDKLTVHSLEFATHIPNVTVIDKVTTIGDVTLSPWLVGNQWKSISKIKSKYMFGHFELPMFYLNAKIMMPDHGELQASHFTHQDYVFSGHFHQRQNKDKIWYIGNAFPHNYSDAWDDKRGMMILEWNNAPEFKSWDDAPKFRTLNLSRLIDEKDSLMKSKMYLKVNLDIDISFEEANFLKETFIKDYDIREISLVQEKNNLDGTGDDSADVEFESVNTIVTSQLVNIESEAFDKKLLLDIYNNI